MPAATLRAYLICAEQRVVASQPTCQPIAHVPVVDTYCQTREIRMHETDRR